jgi:hypothetical protein
VESAKRQGVYSTKLVATRGRYESVTRSAAESRPVSRAVPDGHMRPEQLGGVKLAVKPEGRLATARCQGEGKIGRVNASESSFKAS